MQNEIEPYFSAEVSSSKELIVGKYQWDHDYYYGYGYVKTNPQGYKIAYNDPWGETSIEYDYEKNSENDITLALNMAKDYLEKNDNTTVSLITFVAENGNDVLAQWYKASNGEWVRK